MAKLSKTFKQACIIIACIIVAIISFLIVYTICSNSSKNSEIVGKVKTKSVELNNGVKMDFVLIHPGSFVMGTDENSGDEDEGPQHKVSISQQFYIGKFEVTQEQWESIMGNNPSKYKGKKLPVDSVSWNDCQKFIDKLRDKTGQKFDLPTEAQWEYVCRAGTMSPWHFGEDSEKAKEYGWIEDNSKETTHPVGKKKANPWGIYDMYGNVQEWCSDFYSSPYPKGDAVDPKGPEIGEAHVLRGGAWGEDSTAARSAYRNCVGGEIGHEGTGLRCVLIE